MEKPSCTNDSAVHDAGRTISTYIAQAINAIDKHLGEGFAAANPQLLGACVAAQSADYAATSITAALYEVAESVNTASENLSTAHE